MENLNENGKRNFGNGGLQLGSKEGLCLRPYVKIKTVGFNLKRTTSIDCGFLI